MTETGFIYFREAMQAWKKSLEPKVRPAAKPKPEPKAEPLLTLKRPPESPCALPVANPPPIRATSFTTPPHAEDYTGAICLLHLLTSKYPVYEEVLIDAEDYPRLSQFDWRLVKTGNGPEKRVVRRGDLEYIHRVVMNAPPDKFVDHIFHNPQDNRKGKLRTCTPGQNNANIRGRAGGTSQYRGVSKAKRSRKWRAMGKKGDAWHYLGLFESEAEAARAYNEYARSVHGEFAYQNSV